jgi:hypothetical protein
MFSGDLRVQNFNNLYKMSNEKQNPENHVSQPLNMGGVSGSTFFLCSQKVVDFAKPVNMSKPFKSGWKHDEDSNYFIAVLNFEEIETHYNQLSDDEQADFWLQEIVGGTMDISKLKLKYLKENGVFFEIGNIIGLTTTKNQAMTLFNLAEKFNCNPIELINKIA